MFLIVVSTSPVRNLPLILHSQTSYTIFPTLAEQTDRCYKFDPSESEL